jgi:hypothetical protein
MNPQHERRPTVVDDILLALAVGLGTLFILAVLGGWWLR